jgi:hypothetical protein
VRRKNAEFLYVVWDKRGISYRRESPDEALELVEDIRGVGSDAVINVYKFVKTIKIEKKRNRPNTV